MNLSRMYWMLLRLQGIRLSVKAESQWIAFQDVMYCNESEGENRQFFQYFSDHIHAPKEQKNHRL